jgi:hypothetical protein
MKNADDIYREGLKIIRQAHIYIYLRARVCSGFFSYLGISFLNLYVTLCQMSEP